MAAERPTGEFAHADVEWARVLGRVRDRGRERCARSPLDRHRFPDEPSTAVPRITLGAVSVSAANSAIWAAEDGSYLNCGLSGMAVVASDLLPNGFHDDSFPKKLDDSGFIESILG